MPKVTAYQIMFDHKPSPGPNLYATAQLAADYVKRHKSAVPEGAKHWSFSMVKVDKSEHIIGELEPMRKYTPPPPGSDVHYKKGASCPKLGKQHKYILSGSGTYEKCLVCGSCRSLGRGSGTRASKTVSSTKQSSSQRLTQVNEQLQGLIAEKQQLEGPTILHPKRILLQKPLKKIAIPRWASKELPRGNKRDRFEALLATDSIAVVSDKKLRKTKIIRRMAR